MNSNPFGYDEMRRLMAVGACAFSACTSEPPAYTAGDYEADFDPELYVGARFNRTSWNGSAVDGMIGRIRILHRGQRVGEIFPSCAVSPTPEYHRVGSQVYLCPSFWEFVTDDDGSQRDVLRFNPVLDRADVTSDGATVRVRVTGAYQGTISPASVLVDMLWSLDGASVNVAAEVTVTTGTRSIPLSPHYMEHKEALRLASIGSLFFGSSHGGYPHSCEDWHADNVYDASEFRVGDPMTNQRSPMSCHLEPNCAIPPIECSSADLCGFQGSLFDLPVDLQAEGSYLEANNPSQRDWRRLCAATYVSELYPPNVRVTLTGAPWTTVAGNGWAAYIGPDDAENLPSTAVRNIGMWLAAPSSVAELGPGVLTYRLRVTSSL